MSQKRLVAEARVADSLRSEIEQRFDQVHPTWVEAHLELLGQLRDIFGNDLDKIIILGVIGQRMYQQIASDGPGLLTADENLPIDWTRLTNIESIHVSTGIPRESVRRKVMELVAKGWVRRDQRGHLMVDEAARRALRSIITSEARVLSKVLARLCVMLELAPP